MTSGDGRRRKVGTGGAWQRVGGRPRTGEGDPWVLDASGVGGSPNWCWREDPRDLSKESQPAATPGGSERPTRELYAAGTSENSEG